MNGVERFVPAGAAPQALMYLGLAAIVAIALLVARMTVRSAVSSTPAG